MFKMNNQIYINSFKESVNPIFRTFKKSYFSFSELLELVYFILAPENYNQ
jgi:hypothetical protein